MLLGITFILLFSTKFLVNFTSAQTVSCNFPDTGTVLFKHIDLQRLDCWSRDEIALLYSRRVFHELLPKQIPRNILHIYEYFELCLVTMEDVVTSDYTYLMMALTLADVFGGFLKAYGLPLMNEAYYEGYVDYINAKKLYSTQDLFVEMLSTNGDQWARRMMVKKYINKVLPLTQSTIDTNACAKLITNDKMSQFQKRELGEESVKENVKGLIPLPLLDDVKKPNTIAVPFVQHSLYNLHEKCSYNILLTYYTTVSDCITQMNKDGRQIKEQSVFDQKYYTWLKSNVLPHLKEETLYVGFSNVFRIEETIKHKEGILGPSETQSIHDESKIETILTTFQKETDFKMSMTSSILCIVILALLLCITCFLYWICFRHYLCCCTTIKYNIEPSTNDDEALSTDSTDSLLRTSTTSSNETHKFKTRFNKQKSKSDTKLIYTTNILNQSYSLPSLEVVDEKQSVSQYHKSHHRRNHPSSKKKKEDRSVDKWGGHDDN